MTRCLEVTLTRLNAALPLARAASFASALLGLSACAATLPPTSHHGLVDHAVPDFKRRTIDGTEVDTAALRGHVVVVKFFAKYCEPCKRTLPAIEELAESRKDVTFIGIAEDERESDVREVVSTFHLSFPVIHDNSNVLAGRYRVNEMPVTFVVDPMGGIRWVGDSSRSHAEIVQAVQAVAK